METKAGKRVNKDKVKLLQEVLEKLGTLLSWSTYEDATKEDRVQPYKPKPKVAAPATSRISPNWNAKVGETIIGNLVRGAGGKFASKRNITDMMTMLEKANISPEMFQAMQALLAGEKYTNETILSQLREAGLVTADGVPTGKANDVIRAIKTADPKNLSAVLTPKAGGGGGGGGGAAKKPTKEEIEQENIDKTGETLVQRGKMTQEEFDAFKAFASGEDIDPALEAKLKEMGLIGANGALTREGKDLMKALSAGETRDALDALANAKGETTVTDSVTDIADQIVKAGALSKKEADAFVKFAQGEKISNADAEALLEKGLLGKVGDNYYLTGSNSLVGGRGLWTAMQDGKPREAMDAITKAAPVEDADGEPGTDTTARLPEQIRQNNIETASNKILEAKALSQDEIGGLLNFVAGGKASEETLAALMDKGLLTKTPRGNYVRSDSGKRFLQALESGNGDSALVALQNKAFGNKVFEGRDGNTWLLTWTTNAFEDREDETFSTKAIEDYIARLDGKDVKGTCQFWHIPGSDFATIKWQGGVGRFLVEMSTFDETPVGEAFKAFFKKYPDSHPVIAPNGWGCSHGYVYRSFDRTNGVYNWFDKKETTVLPVDAAANVFTLAKFGIGEKKMKLSENQKKALDLIGSDTGVENLAEMIISAGESYTKLLEGSGVRFKSANVRTRAIKAFGKKMDEVLPMVEDEEIKAEMVDMAEAVADEPEAVMRRLMELTAQVVDEDVRAEMESLIVLLAPIEAIEPDEEMEEDLGMEDQMSDPVNSVEPVLEDAPVDEPIVEDVAADVPVDAAVEEVPMEEAPAEDVVEEVPEEDVVEKELTPEEQAALDEEEKKKEEEIAMSSIGTESSKEFDIQQIAKALNLKGLQEVIQSQSAEITQLTEIALAMKALSEGYAANIQDLRDEVEALKALPKEVPVENEVEAAQKQMRFAPVWGGVQASRAVSTVVSTSDKTLRKPSVPSTISSMSQKIIRG